jgi:hypothetical protein
MTSSALPLDVYFFRQMKIFARKFYDHVFLDDLKVEMHHRDNVIKMQSLIHNQL